LVLIVVGSVALLLILLIIGTIVYKQKVTWFNRIERFRNKHQESEPQSVMVSLLGCFNRMKFVVGGLL
jgi:hypothetical protein